ncbi:MAG TPA: ATP-binding cassette domain-containing protein, partial [Pirellulales bacterium]|nr:ATP-binding cassette domain-containing protein [Pirellulales bacterium]
PVEARRLGIVTVHQEAELFGTLSVAENMALEQGLPTGACGWVQWTKVFDDARSAMELLGEPLDVRQLATRLSVAQRHMAQIAAAVRQQARILVLDEPTSALTASETQWLFDRIARFKQAGIGILYISHRQEEIFQLADRITVLRDGRRVWSGPRASIDRAELIQQMIGRAGAQHAVSARCNEPTGTRPTRLRVNNLSGAGGRFSNVTLAACAGEVLGIYGLVGAGRSEFARVVYGLQRASAGTIELDGQRLSITSPGDAVAVGIAYLPEDRLRQGVFRGLSVRANTVMTALRRLSSGVFTSLRREQAATAEMISALSIKCRDAGQPLEELSGGNQQKVVLARLLLADPAVLILDEPTRGIDIAAKDEIHQLVRQSADRGAAIILISSDLAEVLENSDRIVVFRQGEIVARFESGQATRESVAAAALGVDSSARTADIRRAAPRGRGHLGQWSLALAAAALMIVLALSSSAFLTTENLLGLLSSASVLTILSLAAAVIIVAGGIDISLGSLIGLAEGVAALVLKLDYPPVVTIPGAVLGALAIGAAGGLTNATLAIAGQVHPIVVTLGTMTVFRGLLIWLTGGDTITDLPAPFVNWSSMRLLGANGAVIVGVLTALAVHVWLSHLR